MARGLSGIRVSGNEIEAQAGAMLSVVSRRALEASLSGMEALSGIPGTLGGALVMNAGAFGSEMADIVKSVRVLDEEGNVLELSGEQMKFGYRTSILQEGKLVALSAKLELKEGVREEILALMEEYRQRRQEKQPLEYPSAGSTFKRPEGHFAGALIDEAGLRGFRIGGAQVSEKHCGFVINAGDASASDVLEVIRAVQKSVYEHSGVKLEPEIRMLGFEEL
jgi:UDP-N-acetylmuramate dehydrogenase